MPNTVNRGGEGWTADNQAYRAALESAAQRYGGAQAPQLLQVMLNMGRLETNWTNSGSMPGGGWFQMSPAMLTDMRTAWGYPVQPTEIVSAADALARFITEVGTGTGLGQRYGTPRSDTINFEVGPGMWHGGIPGYTRFLTGTTEQSQDGIGPLSTRYTIQALQGAATADQLSQPLRERYEQLYGVNAWPENFGNSGMQIGTTGIGSDVRHPFFPGGSSLAPEVEQRLQQGMDFLDAWAVSDPSRATAIEGLAAGPGAYLSGDFPWTQGQVSQPYGEALQYYGYMPSNLRFNAQTGNWDPTANPVSTEGPWGTAALSNWVQDSVANPNVSEGQRWYVQQIGGSAAPPGGLETWDASPWGTSGNANTNWTIGLGGNSGGALSNEPIGGGLGGSGANVATAGVDVGNWLGNWARQYFQPAADRGIDVWDATPDITTWDANPPGVNVLAAPDNGIQVWSGDVTNWVPAGGTWGTPGLISPYVGWQEQQRDLFYNPNTLNWGTPGTGFDQNAVTNWSPTTGYSGTQSYPGLPPAGTYSGTNYPGSAILPPVGTYTFDAGAEGAGPGYEGSYGLTNPGDSGLANAIGASQLENYYATMAGLYKGDIAIAAAPPPVTYGNNNPGTGNVVPASNVNTNLPGPTNPWIGWDMNFVNLY